MNSIDKDERMVGIFMDLSKAFDSVSHSQFILKLEEIGITKRSLKWLKSYLEKTSNLLS